MILVGTGFASTFFLWSTFGRPTPGARVLVLERGPRKEHREIIELQFPGLLLYGISGVPQTMIVGLDGRVEDVHVGGLPLGYGERLARDEQALPSAIDFLSN